ncbi:N-acetylneuraminate synthase family protein, partial [Candidatus Parcubacteria bacterium]|nr:N-acetylneuraminate synthase family protein [Candidatus Parcubacteria bacterium]
GEPIFIIAEIGDNHHGGYFMAKRCGEEAAKAGADAVKLQKRFITEVFAKELIDRPQEKDQIFGKTYGEYRRNLELDEDDLIKLKKLAESLGMIFFVTPFDKRSADFLESIDMDLYKIASFDMTNIPLLQHVAKKNKPMILSVGMSTWDEIDEAVKTILQYNKQLMIKHCVSIYPTPDEKMNLATIAELKTRYAPLPIGYSGHEKDILPTLMAVALGALTVERHFTLDNALPGPDHSLSIEPQEFKEMVDAIRRIERLRGSANIRLQEEELRTRKKHGKSIVALKNIPAGTVITADMLTCKSPGYGLKPNMLEKVVGKKTNVDISEDTVITEDSIIWN